MEVYFTEKEKKVELAPQPQLDIFDLMAQPMPVQQEADVYQGQGFEKSAFEQDDGEMNASGSDSESHHIKVSLNQMEQQKVKNFGFQQNQEEFKANDYQTHVDDDLLADIAKVSSNLKMNEDQQVPLQNYQDFDF